MFNIGGDDKEKLEENMEEIKKLVNQDSQEPEEAENDTAEEQDSEIHQKLGSPDEDFGGPDIPDQDIPQNQEEPELQEPEPQQNEQENMQQPQGQADSPAQQQQPPQQDTVGQGNEELDRLHDDIKNQISEIEQGSGSRRRSGETEDTEEIERRDEKVHSSSESEEPLFLDVEKFKNIREMVEEMHYLTTEMDDVMQHLEAGVEEDQETVGEAGQIVDEFQARRDRIEQTLREN
jgi:hypothetical protein